MSSNAQPRWLLRDDSPSRYVITVCGGKNDIRQRLSAMGQELPHVVGQTLSPRDWREPRAGWLEAEFDASPAEAGGWLDAIQERIDDADVYIQPQDELGKRLLICDMDMTIVAAETLDEVAMVLGLGDRIATITSRAMRGELDFDSALRERISMLAGQSARIFDEVARSLVFSPGAQALLDGARAAGVRTILISGGFEQVVYDVAKRLNFDEAYCNRLEVEGERLTGEVIEPIVNAAYKRNTLIERSAALNIPLAACCAIGDGANDLPMLQEAGLGIAYRGKPILRNACPCRIDHTDLSTALAFMGLTTTESSR